MCKGEDIVRFGWKINVEWELWVEFFSVGLEVCIFVFWLWNCGIWINGIGLMGNFRIF